MFRNATAGSTSILNDLRTNLDDENKWLELVRAQISPEAQTEILHRAVATVPSSHTLWTQLIHAKTSQNDYHGLKEILKDALSLFPTDTTLWQTLLTLFPSTETFSAALRYIDNSGVWPAYLKYLIFDETPSTEDRINGCTSYLEFDASKLMMLIESLVGAGRLDVATQILLSTKRGDWEVWRPVVLHDLAGVPLLEAALHRFPAQDAEIVPRLARLKLDTDFKAARTILLRSLESPSSVSSFCQLFVATTQLYEHQIETNLRSQGQGGWDTARGLTEYANIIRKRPLLISEAAIAEQPNNISVWLNRAELWQHRPHIAADVIETALRSVDPLRTQNGEIADLHIRYAALLVANGSDATQAVSHLELALQKSLNTRNAKAKIYIALADTYQGAGNNVVKAIEVLETGIEAVPRHMKLWTHYISVLVEAGSEKILEAFSRCCVERMATMRIVTLVAGAFPRGSSNQVAVFDKGISIFPVSMALPLWRAYIDTCSEQPTHHQRELYVKALSAFRAHKGGYEELVLQYFEFERVRGIDGSLLSARKQLSHILPRSTNIHIWEAYIYTFGNDTEGKRQAFELAIDRLNDAEAASIALKMAEFENSLGENERSETLHKYASQLKGEDHWPSSIDFVPAAQS